MLLADKTLHLVDPLDEGSNDGFGGQLQRVLKKYGWGCCLSGHCQKISRNNSFDFR
jgi:hypothetical protein